MPGRRTAAAEAPWQGGGEWNAARLETGFGWW